MYVLWLKHYYTQPETKKNATDFCLGVAKQKPQEKKTGSILSFKVISNGS